jgi:hypothetical protein
LASHEELKLRLRPHFGLELELGFLKIFLGYWEDRTILNIKISSITHEKLELKLGPI